MTNGSTNFEKSGREKVREFQRGSIFAEVYEKVDSNSGKTYFDVKIVREFIVEGERRRGPYVQQRDLRDVVVVTILAMEFISDRHREIRRGGPYDKEETEEMVEGDDDYEKGDDGYFGED